jgi:hypothetical protein
MVGKVYADLDLDSEDNELILLFSIKKNERISTQESSINRITQAKEYLSMPVKLG